MRAKAVVLLIVLGMLLTYSSALSEQKKFKLGAILALSGNAASAGEACRNGMTLAYDSLPQQTRDQFEIIYEDDGNVPRNTIAAFNKLTAADGINAAVGFSSGTSAVIAPLAEQKKLPLIAVASDSRIVNQRKYVVNFWVTPEEQMKVLMAHLAKLRYRRIARVSATQEFLVAIRDAFDRSNRGVVEVVLDEEFATDVKDFRSFLTKLKSLGEVDAIYVQLYFGQVGLFAKQARELGVALPLFAVETFEDSNEVKVSAGALIGQWYVQADDGQGEFLKSYQAKYPGASTYSAGNCHDIVLLVADALQQGKAPGHFNDYLHQVRNFSGAMGTFSSTGDNRFSLPATVKIVTADGFKRIDEAKTSDTRG